MTIEADWQPIASYPADEFVLLRAGGRPHFGKRRGQVWVEFVDDQLLVIGKFEPTEWAPCDMDRAADMDLIG